MRMFLITDNTDTLTGMHLAGINGVIAHNKPDFQEAFKTAVSDKSIGILLIMESFSIQYPEVIGSYKAKNKSPLIIEIPDRHGTGRCSDFITSYIDHAIGLKL